MPASSSSFQKKLEEQLMEFGTKLLNPPSSVDELLKLLDKIEQLLVMVEQAPPQSMQDAMLPSMRGLAAAEILGHLDKDVKVSVASCISEITRITAPDAPYNDETMKEFFQLALASFENLPYGSGRRYTKAVSILETVAKFKSCLVMLDLELDDLVVDMFNIFSKSIRSNHPHSVSSAMERIMTMLIEENEDIPFVLLTTLLESVKKERQNAFPLSWKLSEKVITNCATKLKPYLEEAVKSMGITLDEYAQVVAFICQNNLDTFEHIRTCSSQEHMVELAPENVHPEDGYLVIPHVKQVEDTEEQCKIESIEAMKSNTEAVVSKKRGWKPNSLMNPDEGYDYSWMVSVRKGAKLPHHKKPYDNGVDISSEREAPLRSTHEKATGNVESPSGNKSETRGVSLSPNDPICCGSKQKRGCSQERDMTNKDAVPNTECSFGEDALAPQVKKVRKSVHVSSEKKFKDQKLPEPMRHPRKKKNVSKTEQEKTLVLGVVGSGKRTKAAMSPKDASPNTVSSSRDEALTQIEQSQKSADVSLKRELKDRRDSEAKLLTCSRKKENITKTEQGKTVVPGRAVKGTKAAAGVEKKLQHKSVVKEFKKNRGSSAFDNDCTGTYNSKRIILEPLESCKAEIKLKSRVSGNIISSISELFMASEMLELEEQLVGKRIKVWWPKDKMFYEGVVDFYYPTKKRHKVLYNDGEVEVLNLHNQRWKLIADEEQDPEIQIPSVSSARDLKRRRKTSSAKLDKVGSSTRRLQASKCNTEPEASKSGGEIRVDSMFAGPKPYASQVKRLKTTKVGERLGFKS